MASVFKVLSFVIFLITLVVGSLLFGEILLVLAYVTLPIAVITRWPRRKTLGWTAVALSGTALALHLWGFKLLGRATVADLESLHKPRRIAALEPPNTIRFADGSAASVAHVFFPHTILVTNPTSGYYESFRGFQNLRVLIEPERQPPTGIQVEMIDPTNDTSGAVCLWKQTYWCGNTWTPHFFPERLPRRVRVDLAPILVMAGLALPTPDYVTESSRRHGTLIGSLENSVIAELPQHHPEVEQLALALIELGHWEKGVDLLIETGAADLITSVRARILSELEKVRVEAPSSLGMSNGWMTLMLRIDPQRAHQAMTQLLSSVDFEVERASALAGFLAEFGDLQGFDLLIKRLEGPGLNAESSRRLSQFLRSWFRFDIYLNGGGCPDDIGPEFIDWYREVRPRLSCKRLPAGRQGFALDGGVPFDSAYYESMKTFKDRIAQRHGRPVHRYRFFD